MDAILQKIIRENSVPEPNTGCWLWLGGVLSSGYGDLIYKGTRGAHRLSLYAFTDFDLNSDLMALHKCPIKSIKLCVNYEHLYPGTDKDNGRDKSSRREYASKKTKLIKFCKHGHEQTKNNVYVYHGIRRGCRVCKREISTKYYYNKVRKH